MSLNDDFFRDGGMFSLAGQTALVTGASSGIGLHIAKVFAKAGASVVLAARRVEAIDAELRRWPAETKAAFGVYLDVTAPETIEPALESAVKHLGRPIDILFNNAGVIHFAPFLEQPEEEVARILDTNLKGGLLMAQATARRMAESGGGCIVNVASTAGLGAAGMLSSYAASKAGLIHLTRVMAIELAHRNIRVNALCPGNFETDMHQTFVDQGVAERLAKRIPQKRFGRLDDLDGAVLLLASDAGRYITGVALPVDGGQTLAWM